MPHSNFNLLQLSKSYEKIEKALSAGDPCKGGYVSFNYLKIVLDTFIYQIPRRIFIQLMKRWESHCFLDIFSPNVNRKNKAQLRLFFINVLDFLLLKI